MRRTLLILKEIPATGRKFLHETVPKKQNRNNSRIRTVHTSGELNMGIAITCIIRNAPLGVVFLLLFLQQGKGVFIF